MMDITFLEGQDGEVVVMELAAVTPRVTVSSHMYLRDRTAGIKYQRLTLQWCNWNDGDVQYIELETVLNRDALSTIAVYFFTPQNQFISSPVGYESFVRGGIVVLDQLIARQHVAQV